MREDAAVLVCRHLQFDVLIAGMGRGDHVLDPILDPLHRTAQLQRETGADELLGIDRRLLAEPAAGVRDDHANVGLGQAKMLGEVMPHHIGKLVAHPYGQRERIFPIAGDTAAAFQAQRLLAADLELPLDHGVGVAERFVHLAALVLALDEIIIRAGSHARAASHPARPVAGRSPPATGHNRP